MASSVAEILPRILPWRLARPILEFLERRQVQAEMAREWDTVDASLERLLPSAGAEHDFMRGPGFHCDRNLIRLADHLLESSKAFIETGSYIGFTTYHVGRCHQEVRVFSCDVDPAAVKMARQRCHANRNTRIDEAGSPDFLYRLFETQPDLASSCSTFWLDAHWGDDWILDKEIAFITQTIDTGFIMIDDFKIPGRPEFRFDSYGGTDCDLDLIRPALAGDKDYSLVTPVYDLASSGLADIERTEVAGGLTGAVAVIVGSPDFQLPPDLGDRFTITSLSN